MARFSPQTNFFQLSMKLKKTENYIFYSIFILSLIFTYLDNSKYVNYLSILSLIILTILKFIIEHYQEKGECSRRKDFFDNSFGSKFSVTSSLDYYDNNEIDTGLYKVLVNVYENSYFSSAITSAMKKSILVKNVFLIIIVIGFSIYGFKNSNFALPILQLFLSKYFIEDLITISNYNAKVESIFEKITSIFAEGLSKNNINNTINQSKVISILIEYETNISHSKLFLDSKIFNKLNSELTNKWSEIKNKYEIE